MRLVENRNLQLRSDSAKIADVMQAKQQLLSDQETLESPRSANLGSVQDRPGASSRHRVHKHKENHDGLKQDPQLDNWLTKVCSQF